MTTEMIDASTDTDPAELNPGGEDRGDIVAEPAKPPTVEDLKALAQQDPETVDDKGGAADPEPAKAKPILVPKARLDETIAERNELRQMLAQALAGQRPQQPEPSKEQAPEAKAVDLDALEEAYAQSLLDGDMAKSKEIRRQIRTEEARLATEAALTAVNERAAQQEQDAKLKLLRDTGAELRKQYPALDHEGEAADAEAIKDVQSYRDYLVAAKGKPLHIALREAVEMVAKDRGWNKPAASEHKDTRAEAQRVKNAAAANSQPPSLESGIGERAMRPRQLDFEKLSEKEFAALSEEDKKRARGDIV